VEVVVKCKTCEIVQWTVEWTSMWLRPLFLEWAAPATPQSLILLVREAWSSVFHCFIEMNASKLGIANWTKFLGLNQLLQRLLAAYGLVVNSDSDPGLLWLMMTSNEWHQTSGKSDANFHTNKNSRRSKYVAIRIQE